MDDDRQKQVAAALWHNFIQIASFHWLWSSEWGWTGLRPTETSGPSTSEVGLEKEGEASRVSSQCVCVCVWIVKLTGCAPQMWQGHTGNTGGWKSGRKRWWISSRKKGKRTFWKLTFHANPVRFTLRVCQVKRTTVSKGGDFGEVIEWLKPYC